MRAYLGVDREVDWFRTDAAREGNEALRRFLEGGFPTISELEPKPDWVSAVRSFPEVLSRNPGQRFAEGWLAGNTAEFEDASRRLSLKGTSWLVKDVLQAALSTTYALNDEQFITRIPSFLSAADEPRFKSLRDDIYAGLLTRYSTVTTPPVHPGLRDALVAAWKNPWLPRNESAWARVPENARQMVASWLKLELIHQFFEVLSEDGRQDRRRFEFWRRYHEHMDDVYFALGSRSYHSQSPDIKKLRAALDGRLFELTNTEADNNAFIMCMGKTIVVEFSKTGNAAYRYDRQQLQLDVARKSIGIGELKHDRTRRMLHKFAHGREWEQLFSSFLGEAGHFDARINSGRRASQPPPLPPPTTAKFAKLFAPDISAFAQDRGITLNDHRSKGGSLWVLTDLSDPAVSRQLEVWGFTYRAGKGWWTSTE